MAKRVDANQAEIVAGLRAVGASVQHLHTIGEGCPDLLVGFRGANYVLEVKHRGGKLTADELSWHLTWRGQKAQVFSLGEALQAIGAIGVQRERQGTGNN